MKKTFVLVLLLVISITSISQTKKEKTGYDKEYLLKKRSQNNTTAHLMLWGGLGASITSFAISTDLGSNVIDGVRKDNNAGEIIFFTGLVSMVGSIPFFAFAAQNKKASRSLSFKNEIVPRLSGQNFVYNAVPSLSLKISL